MRVGVHRHRNLAVSQNFLQDLWVDIHTQQYRRRTMAQVMKTDVWETCLREEEFELVKDISCWVKMGSNRGTKNVIVFLPSCTSCFAFFLQLLDTVFFE